MAILSVDYTNKPNDPPFGAKEGDFAGSNNVQSMFPEARRTMKKIESQNPTSLEGRFGDQGKGDFEVALGCVIDCAPGK